MGAFDFLTASFMRACRSGDRLQLSAPPEASTAAQYCACAALAKLAAVFRAGQVEVLTKNLEQRPLDWNEKLVFFAIDGED